MFSSDQPGTLSQFSPIDAVISNEPLTLHETPPHIKTAKFTYKLSMLSPSQSEHFQWPFQMIQ